MLTYTAFLNRRAKRLHDYMANINSYSSMDLEEWLTEYSNLMREKCMYRKMRRSQRAKNQSMLWEAYIAVR